MTRKDISNAKAEIEKTSWRLHSNDAQSVRMYTQKYPDRVLLYQEQKLLKGGDVMLQLMADERSRREALRENKECDVPVAPSREPTSSSSAGTQQTGENSRQPTSSCANDCQQAEEDGKPQQSQWQPRKLQDGYFSDFVLGLTRPELMAMLIKFGHNRHMSIDATHSTNRAKVC